MSEPTSLFNSSTTLQPHVGPRRFVYAGIPGATSQRNLRYSILSGKQGNKEFRLHLGRGSTLRWALTPKEDGQGAKAERLPTIPAGQAREEEDGQEEMSGVMQVHKSSGDEIYGTMQDGKTNQSLKLIRNPDGSGWDMQPAQSPKARNKSGLDFVTAIKSKTAAPLTQVPDITIPIAKQEWNPTVKSLHANEGQRQAMDTLTYPLTGSNLLNQTLITAGLGLAGGGIYHGVKKLKGLVTGEDDGSTLGGDMLRFGAAAALVPSAYRLGNHMFARRPHPQGSPVLADQKEMTRMALEEGQEAYGSTLPGVEKVAATYGESSLDYRQVINAIRSDTSISSGEREQLINMAREASDQRIPVDPQALTSAGLMALAGYVMSKLMGLGGFGQAAMAGMGGAIGYGAGKSNPNIVRSSSGYTFR